MTTEVNEMTQKHESEVLDHIQNLSAALVAASADVWLRGGEMSVLEEKSRRTQLERALRDAMRAGISVDTLSEASGYTPAAIRELNETSQILTALR